MKDCWSNPETRSYRGVKEINRKHDWGKKHKPKEESFISFLTRCVVLKTEGEVIIETRWFIDSGATTDMYSNINPFQNLVCPTETRRYQCEREIWLR